MSSMPSYIYLMQMDKQYKIGISKNPIDRVVSIRNGNTVNPYRNTPIQVVCYFLVEDARSVERMLHRRFHMQRTVGEWFALSEEDVQWLRAGRFLEPGTSSETTVTASATIRATRQTTGALRAIAARLGYIAQVGPFAGDGDVPAMLEAIARGDLAVVRSAGRSGGLETAPNGGQTPPSAEK